jgi:hypothetical protein
MDYDYKTLEEKYKSLPGDIQLAMSSTDVSKTIMEIAQKHDLFIDQADELSDEVSYVMLGLTKSKNFVRAISKKLEIDEKKAVGISQDINKEIFDKMRDSLKKIEGLDEEGFNEESGNAAPEKPQPGQGEETMMTDAEKAQHKSVISAVEKAGGFIIDKQEDAPLQAEEMVHDAMKESLESKKDIINVIEKESFEPKITETKSATLDSINSILDSRFRGNDKTESSVPLDHLLGDTPGVQLPQTSIKQTPTQQATQNNTPNAEKQMDQASIVDTLLAHGVAMTMEEPSKQDTNSSKPKVRPYDGTDPYREAVN